MRWLIFTFLLFPFFGFSQKGFKLNTATAQHWSGGIAGHVGTNYFMEFICSPKDSIVIDSIYINNQAYKTINSNDASHTAFWFKRDKNHISLIVAESFFQCSYPVEGDTIVKKQKPMPKFNGAALVVYHIHHKKKKMIVKSFTALPPVNYP